MRQSKYFDLSLSGILIPLWIVLFGELIKNKTLLTLIITGIISLIILAIFIRAVYEVIIETDIFSKIQCWKINAIIRKQQKKLKRVISGTNKVSVIDYVFEKLSEIYKPEVCSAIFGELAEKERNSDKQRILLSYIKPIGGLK